jgi:hypothetical protein
LYRLSNRIESFIASGQLYSGLKKQRDTKLTKDTDLSNKKIAFLSIIIFNFDDNLSGFRDYQFQVCEMQGKVLMCFVNSSKNLKC